MAAPYQTIYLHAEAPPKPPVGDACNGCGVCCASAPCPIGMLISRRRTGRCAALVWQEQPQRYVCGVLTGATLNHRWMPRRLQRVVRRLAARSISAGSGCDAEMEATAASSGAD